MTASDPRWHIIPSLLIDTLPARDLLPLRPTCSVLHDIIDSRLFAHIALKGHPSSIEFIANTGLDTSVQPTSVSTPDGRALPGFCLRDYALRCELSARRPAARGEPQWRIVSDDGWAAVRRKLSYVQVVDLYRAGEAQPDGMPGSFSLYALGRIMHPRPRVLRMFPAGADSRLDGSWDLDAHTAVLMAGSLDFLVGRDVPASLRKIVHHIRFFPDPRRPLVLPFSAAEHRIHDDVWVFTRSALPPVQPHGDTALSDHDYWTQLVHEAADRLSYTPPVRLALVDFERFPETPGFGGPWSAVNRCESFADAVRRVLATGVVPQHQPTLGQLFADPEDVQPPRMPLSELELTARLHSLSFLTGDQYRSGLSSRARALEGVA